MKIGVLDLEHAIPGEKPLIVERYYVQRTRCDSFGMEYWADALTDGNIKGMKTLEQAREALIRTRVHYFDRVRWRVIKRIATVTAEEIEEPTCQPSTSS